MKPLIQNQIAFIDLANTAFAHSDAVRIFKVCLRLLKNTENKVREDQVHHAVVTLMKSNCCTSVEPRSVHLRAKRVTANVDIFTVLEDNNMIAIYNTCSARVKRAVVMIYLCSVHLSLSNPQACINNRLWSTFYKNTSYKNVKLSVILIYYIIYYTVNGH